jgi:hypothetical protein
MHEKSFLTYGLAQSRQSAKPFLQSLELGTPMQASVQVHPPPPLVPGGAHLLAGEGVEGSQFRRGYTHCGTLCIYVLCVA